MEHLAELRERQKDLMEKAMVFQQNMRDFKENLMKEVSKRGQILHCTNTYETRCKMNLKH